MKPINEMSLSECIESLRDGYNYARGYYESVDGVALNMLADRIHDLTRWIPVEERLPTEADANKNGNVRWHSDYFSEQQTDCWDYVDSSYTHWKRIDTP